MFLRIAVVGSMWLLAALTAHAQSSLDIYTDSLVNGWQNWSWDSTVNELNTSPVQSGSRSMSVSNLLYGGLFMYPASRKAPNGKLRLLYEAAPLAFIQEQAGGAATDGTRRILEIPPTELHQRTPLYIGSAEDVREAESFLAGTHPAGRSAGNHTVRAGTA